VKRVTHRPRPSKRTRRRCTRAYDICTRCTPYGRTHTHTHTRIIRTHDRISSDERRQSTRGIEMFSLEVTNKPNSTRRGGAKSFSQLFINSSARRVVVVIRIVRDA